MNLKRFLILFGGLIIFITIALTTSFATEKIDGKRHWYSSTYQFVDGHMLYRDVTNTTCLQGDETVTHSLLYRDEDTIYLTDELYTEEPCLSTYYIKDGDKMITIALAQERQVLSTSSLNNHNFKVDVEMAYNFTPLNHHVDSFRPFTVEDIGIELGEKYEPGDQYFATISTHIMYRPFYNDTPDTSEFIESLRVSFSNGETRTFLLYEDYIEDEKTGTIAYFTERFMK
ncbi:MAG: hypothetical protein UMR38_05590 [Candidatus Izemoplasma sp.]|nr:hypothetical protein [Candidatus Izemoplasma sp.]